MIYIYKKFNFIIYHVLLSKHVCDLTLNTTTSWFYNALYKISHNRISAAARSCNTKEYIIAIQNKLMEVMLNILSNFKILC